MTHQVISFEKKDNYTKVTAFKEYINNDYLPDITCLFGCGPLVCKGVIILNDDLIQVAVDNPAFIFRNLDMNEFEENQPESFLLALGPKPNNIPINKLFPQYYQAEELSLTFDFIGGTYPTFLMRKFN